MASSLKLLKSYGPWALLGLIGPAGIWSMVELHDLLKLSDERQPVAIVFAALYPTLILALGFGMSPRASALGVVGGTALANVGIFVLLGFLFRMLSPWRWIFRFLVVVFAYAAIYLAVTWYGWNM